MARWPPVGKQEPRWGRSERQWEPSGAGSCSRDFGCWMERAGRAWVRGGKALPRLSSSSGGKPSLYNGCQ